MNNHTVPCSLTPCRLTPVLREASATHVTSTSGRDEYDGLQDFQAKWLVMESNDWQKRVQVLNRFVNAARVLVYRYRADKRLSNLHDLVKLAGGNSDTLAGGNLVSMMMNKQYKLKPGAAPDRYLKPDKVQTCVLQVYREAEFVDRTVKPESVYVDLCHLDPIKPKVRHPASSRDVRGTQIVY